MVGLHRLLKELVVFFILRMPAEAKVTLLSLNFPLNTTVTHYFCHLAGVKCKMNPNRQELCGNRPLLLLSQTRPGGSEQIQRGARQRHLRGTGPPQHL